MRWKAVGKVASLCRACAAGSSARPISAIAASASTAKPIERIAKGFPRSRRPTRMRPFGWNALSSAHDRSDEAHLRKRDETLARARTTEQSRRDADVTIRAQRSWPKRSPHVAFDGWHGQDSLRPKLRKGRRQQLTDAQLRAAFPRSVADALRLFSPDDADKQSGRKAIEGASISRR